jgi:hypothetical protein
MFFALLTFVKISIGADLSQGRQACMTREKYILWQYTYIHIFKCTHMYIHTVGIRYQFTCMYFFHFFPRTFFNTPKMLCNGSLNFRQISGTFQSREK